VYRVTTNACLDELRRRRRRPLPSSGDGDRPEPARAAPDDTIADQLRLDAALRSLPDEFRLPVVLRDVCDLDYAEIATVLGIPGGTVRSRIARGRGLLARALGNPSTADDRPTPQP
jgi:RNA polymerase sigma-70 factor (ECF subfamily)